MKMARRRFLTVFLLLIFAISIGYISWKTFDRHKGAEDYAAAAELAGFDAESMENTDTAERDKFAQMLEGLDMPALREVNGDVVGWIAIPDTEVFYPVMQSADNNYYLKRTWKKESSSVGAIFLECQNSPDFNDFHSILYGHQMRDGSMFGGLKQFADDAYWREHPTIYLVTGSGVEKYDIFAAFEVGVHEIVYRLNIEEEGAQQEMIVFCLAHSVIDTGITPAADGHILTLSTCTGRGYASRWIVQGVRQEESAIINN